MEKAMEAEGVQTKLEAQSISSSGPPQTIWATHTKTITQIAYRLQGDKFPIETVPRQILTSQWQSSLKQVYVHNLSWCCIIFFWVVGSFIASKSIMDTSSSPYPLLIQYILLRLLICNQKSFTVYRYAKPQLVRLTTLCKLSGVFLVFSCDSQAVISLHDERSTGQCMVNS
jgi:hypothetical protein